MQNNKEVIGTIKAPTTVVDSEEELLYYLKRKIETERGDEFDKRPVTSTLTNKKFKVLNKKFNWTKTQLPVLQSVTNQTINQTAVDTPFVRINSYSCAWNGSIFEVCESVEWAGGSASQGYITGGEAINVARKYHSSPYTYCQNIDIAGEKAINAYLLDEDEMIIDSDFGNTVTCSVNNDTFVDLNNSIINQSIINETIEINEDLTVVEDINVTGIQHFGNGQIYWDSDNSRLVIKVT